MVLGLYLMRHAETEYNVHNKLIGGQSNFLDLSDRGIKQAETLGKRIKLDEIFFDEVYCSTALRTRKTAEIVCEGIGFPLAEIKYSEKLLELSQGEWEGKNREEIYTEDVIRQMRELTWNFKAPNGESQREVENRIHNYFFDDIINERENENLNVGLFMHGLAMKCLIRKVMNSDPGLTYRISLDNCSITHLKYKHNKPHKGWSVIKINDNAHLRDSGFQPNTFD
jgi:probable phosphoglycerate mutase